ncbi:hypothetical protein B0J13DRAFT_621018 [Dactylonectria estremocensis]|uniref:Cytidyltransferase-like domain-containing protein n=1 Tax=Dactylonectria estremocensis TaxID=1079267 RepID=A0A9P9F038_9HYPO|nr:hypothetical protein B0J13DRAFT_621018 [Dactylonectria estremocensis]
MSYSQLGDLVETICFHGRDLPKVPHRPFNNGKAKRPPRFCSRGVNRILLFPGSFNPPHQGHLDLLRYVFWQAGEDLNLVGAIVVPTDDERLKVKLENEENPILIPREQRVDLWRGKGLPIDWAWIYDQPEKSFTDFQPKLIRKAKTQNIDLKFILLGGPDYIGIQGIPNPRLWNCSEFITSDVCRPVNFRNPNSLRQLPGCDLWAKPEIDRGQLMRQLEAKHPGKSLQDIYEDVDTAILKIERAWVCHKQRRPVSMFRFVPTTPGMKSRNIPSSTNIRHIISTTAIDGILERMAGLALNPCMLVDCIRQLPKTPPRRVVKQQETPEKEEKVPQIPGDDFW